MVGDGVVGGPTGAGGGPAGRAAPRRRPEQPVLLVADAADWRAWLDEHEATSDGVWLTLARKDAVDAGRGPTTLRYAAALDEALCSGWVDGQARGGDADTYGQRFTPRRARSLWSARNVTDVARLRDEGRLRPRGEAEVARAQADGRWDRAYAGPATMEVPGDLRSALDAEPALAAAFAALGGQDRYAACHRVVTATTPAVRARRVAAVLDGLRRPAPDGS